MPLVLRQTVLLGGLVLRRWLRAELPGQLRLRRPDAGRATGAVFLRLMLALMALGLHRTGRGYAELPESVRGGGAALALLFTGLTVATYGFLAKAPVVRTERPVLASAFLEPLPVHPIAVAVGELFGYVLYPIASAALFAGMATNGAWGHGAALGFCFGAVAFLLGAAVADGLRARLAPGALLTLSRVVGGFGALPVLGLFMGERLAATPHVRAGVESLGRAIGLGDAVLSPGADALPLWGAIALLAAAQWALSRDARRRGGDLTPMLALPPPARGEARPVTLETLDPILDARERYRIALPAAFIASGVIVAGAGALLHWSPEKMTRLVSRGVIMTALVYIGFVVLSMCQGFALRAVSRDQGARPLLVTLPIEPQASVRLRSRWIAWRAVLAATPAIWVPLFAVTTEHAVEALWRTAMLFVALALAGRATAGLAFLSAGAFGVDARSSRTGTLERVLLVFFGLGPVFAANLPGALLSLALLGLFLAAVERSAARCVRWVDDPEDYDREIPVWRALLAFGAFLTAQTVVGLVMGISAKDPAIATAVAYVVSGAVLLALTLAARRGVDRPVLSRAWPREVALGVGAGALSLAVAAAWTQVLVRLGVPNTPVALEGALAVVLFALATVVVAPIGEEWFFRGWLHPALEAEAPRLAPGARVMLGAFAFAAIHPAAGFPAVFTLGLLASILRLRTGVLLPGIVAHAVHNGGVLAAVWAAQGTSPS